MDNSVEWARIVLAEEKTISDIYRIKRGEIAALKEKIVDIEQSMNNGYQTRAYCHSSDGYSCSFTGTCDHKEPGYPPFNDHKCLIVKHAKQALEGEGSQ